MKVVEAGWRGYLATVDDMTRTLVRAQVEGNWAVKRASTPPPIALVIDDVGLLPINDRDATGAFVHVVNTRYERRHPPSVHFGLYAHLKRGNGAGARA